MPKRFAGAAKLLKFQCFGCTSQLLRCASHGVAPHEPPTRKKARFHVQSKTEAPEPVSDTSACTRCRLDPPPNQRRFPVPVPVALPRGSPEEHRLAGRLRNAEVISRQPVLQARA